MTFYPFFHVMLCKPYIAPIKIPPFIQLSSCTQYDIDSYMVRTPKHQVTDLRQNLLFNDCNQQDLVHKTFCGNTLLAVMNNSRELVEVTRTHQRHSYECHLYARRCFWSGYECFSDSTKVDPNDITYLDIPEGNSWVATWTSASAHSTDQIDPDDPPPPLNAPKQREHTSILCSEESDLAWNQYTPPPLVIE